MKPGHNLNAHALEGVGTLHSSAAASACGGGGSGEETFTPEGCLLCGDHPGFEPSE
eukprot:COSAG06_NODE_17197_length_955_cov_1.259346_1_plen_55_part_10